MPTGGRSRSFLPTLPDIPVGVPPELREWLRDLKLQLGKFFNDAHLFTPDFRLFGRVSRISLLDLFILEPTEMFMEVFSDTGGAVSSNATNAIREGKLGQILIIENIGVQLVTIKNNAKTKNTIAKILCLVSVFNLLVGKLFLEYLCLSFFAIKLRNVNDYNF